MARCVINLGYRVTKCVGVTIGDVDIDAGNSVMIGERPNDLTAIFFLQFEIATGMVIMVMRVENMGECPAQPVERLYHRFSIRGVNHPDLALAGFPDQVYIVIGTGWNLFDFKRRHGIFPYVANSHLIMQPSKAVHLSQLRG
jgi:hypothetical protein